MKLPNDISFLSLTLSGERFRLYVYEIMSQIGSEILCNHNDVIINHIVLIFMKFDDKHAKRIDKRCRKMKINGA